MREMTLLIRNVRILGGARDFPGPCDVFVSDDKISAIGSFPNKGADEVLDGQGAYLSPGFIDIDSGSDHFLTLFDHPGQEDFIKQGVTTIFGGMCGSSLAPLLYGTLESVRKWGGPDEKINVDWHTVAEFLAAVARRPLAINFGTFVGHSTIRRAILGESLRDLTKNELAVFSETLKRALQEGAYGFSTGLSYVHSKNTPYAEIKTLAKITKDGGGIYATHLRDMEHDIKSSIAETFKIAKEAGVPTLINHFVPPKTPKAAAHEYETALAEIEALPAEANFRFDTYPFETRLLPLYTFLPHWTQTGGAAVMLTNVKDEWFLARIRKEIATVDEANFVIAQAPDNDFLVGKTLAEVRDMYGVKTANEALVKLLIATRMGGTALYKCLDASLVRRALKSPRSFIASSAPSFGEAPRGRQLRSERTTSTFTTFLSLAQKEDLLPLKDAIRKITLEPARYLGLQGRGEIKEGNYADLACFKNNEIKFTVVNGKVVMKEGMFQNRFPGKALRHRTTPASAAGNKIS
jgi:N-acyl-D-amino-acid deacylase